MASTFYTQTAEQWVNIFCISNARNNKKLGVLSIFQSLVIITNQEREW